MIRTFFFLLATLVAASAAERIDLNGEWRMALDRDGTGAAKGWTANIPAAAEVVTVPHTWNIGKYADYEGVAWYFRRFTSPAGHRVELHFAATFYKARVWLNGVEVGSHEGGHTEWFVDATPHLRADNLIAVEIDNRPGFATIPGYAMSLRGGDAVWYDWWHYGGIVRDVWLAVTEPVLIRRQHVRSVLAGETADITDEVRLENHGTSASTVRLRVELLPPDGSAPVQTAEQNVLVAPGSTTATVQMRAAPVKLWYLDQPNVYRVRATLPGSAIEDNYGFRKIEIRDRHLFLNGERVRLTGMTRHEDSPWEGLAETRGTMLHDYREMKELQVTLTRPVHYPQHPVILDFADRNGILLIPEIPMWQFSEAQMTDARVIGLAQQMMGEMLEQAWNHPSILGWSVCNESETNTPGGRRYFEAMYNLVKSLDPDRYVSYADNQITGGADPKINAASVADFVMINQYFGTWSGPEEGLAPSLERAGRDYPDKMFIISEFGAAGIFAPDKVAGDALRRHIITSQMEVFRHFDFIGGAILWCYQDYMSHRNLRPGMTSGEVEIGVVDENRQRNPSFYLWKEENSPAVVDLHWKQGNWQPPSGFTAAVARRAEDALPSYTLRGYRAEWEVHGANGEVVSEGARELPDIGAPHTVTATWPATNQHGAKLVFRLRRPTGFVAFEKTLDWWEGRSGGVSVEDMERQGYKVPAR
ncbi:MAG: glycoside hydrolase family 2 TIM barrel-domain containing protein [Bryobacteraceae bacterium]